MIDRRYYVLMGVVTIIFCLGTIFLGHDTRVVAQRSITRQQQQMSVINDELRQESPNRAADELVTAGY